LPVAGAHIASVSRFHLIFTVYTAASTARGAQRPALPTPDDPTPIVPVVAVPRSLRDPESAAIAGTTNSVKIEKWYLPKLLFSYSAKCARAVIYSCRDEFS
jgi:hypothetical protein